MKDLNADSRIVETYNGDNSSACNLVLDDEYNFTDDQRKATQELQTLYRKLGLEELDDGFEEGFSAYDDPHYDIIGKLKEVNNRFNDDNTPIESDRMRKVRFKESVVDLVVPISPVRSYFDSYNYLDVDYDDDDDYDAYVDENMNNQPYSSEHYDDGEHTDYVDGKLTEEIYEYEDQDEQDVDETETDKLAPEDANVAKQEETEKHNDNTGDSEKHDESSEEEGEYEVPERESVTPSAILDLGPAKDATPTSTDESSIAGLKHDDDKAGKNNEKLSNTAVKETHKSEVNCQQSSSNKSNGIKSHERIRSKSAACTTIPRAAPLNLSGRPTSSMTVTSKNIVSVNSRPTKPDKCLPSYKGNVRSKYGVTEELKREFRKLKQLEAFQKKLKENELEEHLRQKREDAELAFKAWLDAKQKSETLKPRILTKKERKSQKKQGISNYPASDEAFQVWMEQKENQQKKNRFLQEFQELEECDVEITSRARREQCKRAYRKWLRKKNNQRRQQISLQSQLGYFPTHFNYSLPHAIQQADMLKQTFQAYFGRMMW